MVVLPNYLSYSKLYFKNHFQYIGTSISIIILGLYIYPASILLLHQHINYSATIYLFKRITTITDQLLVNSLVKVKKSKGPYIYDVHMEGEWGSLERGVGESSVVFK